jgi:hypothetical protein
MLGLLPAVLLLSLPARADQAPGRIMQQLKELSVGAPAEAAAAPAPKGKAVLLRLPTWELSASRNVEMLAGPAHRLSDEDIAAAKDIFGDSIDYDAVRFVNAKDNVADFSQVWGETIRVSPGGLTPAKLMHELTHVWQYQTSGLGYISDSFVAQICAVATDFDRDEAYKYVPDPEKSFFDYSAEQQAKIVEHYSASAAVRKRPLYQRWMKELRSRKFVPGDRKKLFEEKAAGLMPSQYTVPPLPGFEPDRVMPGVPQLEIRF